MTPEHLICDPLPSLQSEVAATFVLRTIRPASLWRFPDDESEQGACVQIFEPLPDATDAATMAKVAREVGDFWAQYRREEDSLS